MLKKEVEIGGRYYAKVSGRQCIVRIQAVRERSGWNAINERTGKEVCIKSARRLQSKVEEQATV